MDGSTARFTGEIQIVINDSRWDQWELSIINLLDLHWHIPFVSPSPSSVGSLAAGWGDPSGSGAAEGDTSKAPAVPGRSKANKRAYHRQFKAQQKPWTLVRAVGCTARQSQEARVQSLSVSPQARAASNNEKHRRSKNKGRLLCRMRLSEASKWTFNGLAISPSSSIASYITCLTNQRASPPNEHITEISSRDHPLATNTHKTPSRADIEAAIEDLKSQEVPNFSKTIKRYGVYRIILI
ncbi:hypothetical protein TEQG_06457 [Trichophyton equinum CBS 127.97]|uniref:Uncharacterized protein n=1 Tax=Trichophyton equinum (strain ATCC MYA-4606 / CBS 127.97) TaxID=559882 RepID=F2Q075_TRIEC|nr:hypothetical protein TEQG_06457 [Trichophyton equinum CBS 127.97]